MKKILMAASSGGHLEEILALKELNEKYETILITEKTDYEVKTWQKRVYLLPQANRKRFFSCLQYFVSIFRIIGILVKENPDVVLSTGAMIAFPAMLFGKLLGKKIIYIECLFNVDEPTLTGRLVYKFADLFIVQWEEMLQVYPNATYGGRIF